VILEIELKLNLLVREIGSFEQHLSKVGGGESEPLRACEELGSGFWSKSSLTLALRSLVGRRVAQASSRTNRDEVSTRRFSSHSYDFIREEETTGKKTKQIKESKKKRNSTYGNLTDVILFGKPFLPKHFYWSTFFSLHYVLGLCISP